MENEEEKTQEKEQVEREAKEKAAKELEDENARKQTSSEEESGQPSEKTQASPLEEARTLDKSIREGTANLKKLFDKNEKVLADLQMSGKGYAGGGTKSLTEEEAKQEKALEFWKGTPIADAIKKHGLQ